MVSFSVAENHYGHLAASYITDTIRTAFTSLGVVERSNVKTIVRQAAG